MDSVQNAAGQDGLANAAREMANRRWARVRESQAEPEINQEEPQSIDPEERTAPEVEEPAEEASESTLEEGQEEEGGKSEEQSEEGLDTEEDSEEEQPSNTVDLDSLEDDAEIVIDGTPTTARELRESRMRMEDYTRKTQAVAKQREVLQDREKVALYHLGKTTEGLKRQMQQFESINWTEMAQTNPQAYQQQSAMAEAVKRQAHQTEQETQQFLQQVKHAEDAIAREQASIAQKELKSRIKGWNNALYYSLVDYAETTGLDRKEVLKYTDPNVFVLLQKAKAYDEAQKITTQKKVKSSGKRTLRAQAPVTPGDRQARKSNQEVDHAMSLARQEGTVEAAMQALKAKRRAGG